MNFKLIKAVSVYTILGFVPLIASFLLLPLYTRHLTTTDYGVVGFAYIAENYFILFVVFGFNTAIFRFFNDYKAKGKEIDLLMNTFFSSFLIIAILFLVLSLFGERVFEYVFRGNLSLKKYGYFVLGSSISLSFNQLLLQYFRIKEDLKAAIIITIVPFFLSIAGIVTGVVLMNAGATGNVRGRFVGLFLSMIILFIWFARQYSIKFKFDKDIIKALFIYSAPVVLYNIIGNISDTMDRFFINSTYSLSELGIYNLARTLIAPVEIILLSIWNAVTPMIYNKLLSSEGFLQDGKQTYVGRYFDILLLAEFVLMGLIFIFMSPFLKLITSSSYQGAVLYIPLLLLASVGRAYYIVYSFNIFFEKKTRLLPIINTVSMILVYAFLKIVAVRFELLGIAAALVVLKFSQFLLSYYFEIKYDIKYPMKKSFLPASVALTIVLFYYYFYYNVAGYLMLYNLFAGSALILISLFTYRESISQPRNI
ncbi:lipopolysaccharide biosynthesis protein [Chitinophaga polysaccharea]|uniref:lipopolysaccharide biosynthesis protein n=1 Tax=Chitinophaga polysaccharea TaxID=1293035 RepID=UPI00115A342B|nr:lipopolysaccharide biosynthesis protein [Chitinophaga polysaccharea]